jgi:Cys-tRNA(Pro)/Cys-tRNA(Cys) deacylase
MPGNKKLDFKKLAAFHKTKRATMVDHDTAERLTGYHVGGISPFGVKRRFDSIMDESIMQHDIVIINGGNRGTMLKMKPVDIADILNCQVLDIAR